ncbi:lysophospholipid acyltransferase family protein [Methylonatrum kenyense]|uniref:lysophospholipid acyltransferase family protein n=1 Tax=Methylonatrum kenyense TaxID=455253 RepID=UPI0020C112BE|nr:lysophospholipid acyltransferase family protein [Methylonatrum kenyense]MCK8515324.1 lysophospholipid acyltransferase family protein [Methylonatrum kenyense]
MKRVALLRTLLRLMSMLPLPVAHGIGAISGQLAYLLARSTRHVALTNLALCFPDVSEQERRRLARASFRELGKQLLETGIIWFGRHERLRRLVTNPESLDELAGRWPQGHGLVLAGPHLGNWDLTGYYVNSRFTLHHLYRPPRQAELEPLLTEARERGGGRSLPATPSGIRQLYKALRGGGLVAILPDQEARGSGVFAPFFGVPARTMTLLNQMAAKTGAPVVFCFMQRLPWGRGFRLRLVPAPPDIDNPDPEIAATALNKGVEQCVRLVPEQYQWTYKRFRQHPDGNPYKNRRGRQ